jgi:hypothetical protein
MLTYNYCSSDTIFKGNGQILRKLVDFQSNQWDLDGRGSKIDHVGQGLKISNVNLPTLDLIEIPHTVEHPQRANEDSIRSDEYNHG